MCQQGEHGHPPAHSDRRDGGHIRPLRWFIACAEHGQENLLRQEALRFDIQTFLPLIREAVPYRDGRLHRITVPAFPGYVFALCRIPNGWHPLKRCRGVASILHATGSREIPAMMPPGVIEAWLARASEGGVIEDLSVPEVITDPITEGATVRITAGPFTGFQGLVQRTAAERVVVLVSMFGRQGPAELSRSQVEPL
jgi:transcription termination/antitermination protein NusG